MILQAADSSGTLKGAAPCLPCFFPQSPQSVQSLLLVRRRMSQAETDAMSVSPQKVPPRGRLASRD